ncbi:hypothetical protein DRE_04670 [Drechslerella stenobrocha 248]|uniref:Tc toxin complex TcA C-terminal TcB-binding domain-containing protein n=1 Tax=Drechslerella stenobrocha 248 TaxID=1043628 RepID=W7HPP5_9PEZI|nr:hypothetical protein DRE_04670 [Drechslerella stenobrocha 248]
MVAFLKLQLLLSTAIAALPYASAFPAALPGPVGLESRRNDIALSQRYDEVLSNVQLNEYAATLYQNFRSKDQKKVFLRKPYLNLEDAIDMVKPNLTIKSAQIYLYCDLLQFSGGKPVEVPKRTTLYLFAREVSQLSSEPGPLTIKYDQSVVIFFATPDLPNDFPVKFVDAAGGVHELSLNVPRDSYGVLVEVMAGGAPPTPRPFGAPDFALEAMDYMGDLSLTSETFIEDDLPRLLQFQQVLATAWRPTNPQLAMKIYDFIARTTTGSTAAMPIYKQAVSSLSKLRMITDPLQQYVPNLDITQVKSVLDDHLTVAKVFEDSFNSFSQQQADAVAARDAAMAAFTNSKAAVEKYRFLETQARTRLEFAVNALNEAVWNYNNTYNGLALRLATFQSGIAEYATDQTGRLLLTVFVAAATIVLTVTSAGIGIAALPASAAGGVLPYTSMASALKVITTAGSASDNGVKAAADSLGYLAGNLRGGLAALTTTMTTLNALLTITLPALKPNGFGVAIHGIPTNPLERIDAISLSAAWDNWRVLNEMSWAKLSDGQKKIDGASDYYASLYALSNNGKAVLAGQAAFIQVFDDYMEASVNLQTAKAQNAELQRAVDRLENPLVFQTFKRAMFDRLIAVRSWVAVEFNDYAAAYQYYTLTTNPVQRVPVLSPASYYSAAVAELQSDATHAQTSFRSQVQTFSLSSNTAGVEDVFGANWLRDLQTPAGLTFSIPSNSSHFATVSRVRVQRLRCYLIGSQAEEVRLTLTISGSFEDKELLSPYGPRKFVSDSTPLRFNYVPSKNDPNEANTNLVRQDGMYAGQRVFMTPTPFAVWTVKVADAARVLRGVKKMVLLITAEVSHH